MKTIAMLTKAGRAEVARRILGVDRVPVEKTRFMVGGEGQLSIFFIDHDFGDEDDGKGGGR